MEISRYLCRPFLHIFVRNSRKGKQFLPLLHPLIMSAIVFLFEIFFVVQSIQF